MDTKSTNESGSRPNGPKRAALLSAAAELFAMRGYRATTLDDVARATGVKKATLYHYIRSKEELLTTIYGRIFDRIEGAVRPIAALSLPADERLRRMVHAHVEVVAEESAMLAVVFREESELDEPHRAEFQKKKRDYEAVFERVIEEGQKAGAVRPGLTPRLMVRAILGMCNWLYQWYRPDRHSFQKIAAEFTLLLESGWLADGDQRAGAWARPDTVDEALSPARDAVRRTRTALDQLSVELTRAEARLQDGVTTKGDR